MSETELSVAHVDVTTIDEFCSEHNVTNVGLAKIDIEGLEPQAIEGMRKTIERARPHLFVEILKGTGTDTALDRLARHFGYNVYSLGLDGPHFQQYIRVAEGRSNYLFTRMSPSELHRFMNAVCFRIDGCI
jgi:hypothetical protein